MNNCKTYRAIWHDVVRGKQNGNCQTTHHPTEKIEQIEFVLNNLNCQRGHEILELFSGRGNLTDIYKKYGNVTECDRKYKKTGDSYLLYHKLIYEKKKYTVIDLDPYGFPCRLFPDIFLLIDKGILFVTMPKPSVNILNKITQIHLISYFGEQNPSEKVVADRIVLWGLSHWRKVELIDVVDLKSVWRFAFGVEKVKATDYTGIKNQPDEETRRRDTAQSRLF